MLERESLGPDTWKPTSPLKHPCPKQLCVPMNRHWLLFLMPAFGDAEPDGGCLNLFWRHWWETIIGRWWRVDIDRPRHVVRHLLLLGRYIGCVVCAAAGLLLLLPPYLDETPDDNTWSSRLCDVFLLFNITPVVVGIIHVALFTVLSQSGRRGCIGYYHRYVWWVAFQSNWW